MGGSGGGATDFPRYISEAHYGLVANANYGDLDQHKNYFRTNSDGTSTKVAAVTDTNQISLYDVFHSIHGPAGYLGAPYSNAFNPGIGTSRYIPITYPDQLSLAQTPKTRINTLAGQIDGRSAETDFASILLKAATELDISGRLKSLGMTQLFIDADARMLSTGQYATDNSKVAADASMNEVTLWTNFIDEVKAKADEVGMLTTVDWATIESAAVTNAATFIAAALGANNTGVAEITEWEGFIDSVKVKLAECGVLDEIDVPTLFNVAFNEATRAVDEAVRAATNILDSDLIQPIVDGYEDRASYQKNKAIRLFTGQMADINAEHSSAFLIGLALIHAQHHSDVNRFDAELTLSTYQESIRQHGANLNEFFKTGLAAASENLRARSQMFLQALQNLVEMQTARVRYEQALTELFGQAYGVQITGNVEADSVNKRQRDAILTEGVQGLQQLVDIKKRLEAGFAQLYQQLFTTHIGAGIEGATTEKRSRDALLQASVQKMSSDLLSKHELQLAAYDKQQAATAFEMAYVRENFEDDLDLRVKCSMWPIFVLERGANVIAAPSGMAGIQEPGMSKTQSVVSGAFAGGSLGAKVSGGNPIVTGIGAVVGGVMGAL